jgi:hypothetical protein
VSEVVLERVFLRVRSILRLYPPQVSNFIRNVALGRLQSKELICFQVNLNKLPPFENDVLIQFIILHSQIHVRHVATRNMKKRREDKRHNLRCFDRNIYLMY